MYYKKSNIIIIEEVVDLNKSQVQIQKDKTIILQQLAETYERAHSYAHNKIAAT